jgi:hypothetical protein
MKENQMLEDTKYIDEKNQMYKQTITALNNIKSLSDLIASESNDEASYIAELLFWGQRIRENYWLLPLDLRPILNDTYADAETIIAIVNISAVYGWHDCQETFVKQALNRIEQTINAIKRDLPAD